VKLAFSPVALVLEVGVVDFTSPIVFHNLQAFNSENLNAIRKEKAVIKNVKLSAFYLLDIAIKFEKTPFREFDHPLYAGRFSDTLQHGVFGYRRVGCLHDHREFDLEPSLPNVVV
jgi:hypothetical protein